MEIGKKEGIKIKTWKMILLFPLFLNISDFLKIRFYGY